MQPGKLLLVALGAILALASIAGGASDQDGPSLWALRRVLRHFDFEEAQLAPHNMPFNFYRHIAPDRGFPKFGRMALSDDQAASGRWSFRFDLDGGSMSARVPTAVLPAMPDATYVVSTKVRTANLLHARAGIAAWLHDVAGNAIPTSYVESRRIQTNGEWSTLEVTLFSGTPDVSDIVVELQVLQPTHFDAVQHQGTLAPQDVRGTVWFDDVVVRLMPRAELTIADGSLVNGKHVRIDTSIRDLSHEPLRGCLVVTDFDDQTVYEKRFDVHEPTVERQFDLSLKHYGWYRATLDLRNDKGSLGVETLDFTCLPERQQDRMNSKPIPSTFTIELPPARSDASWSADAVTVLNLNRVIAPVFTRQDDRLDLTGDGIPSLKRMGHNGVDIISSIDALPIEEEPNETLTLDEPATWRDLVHQLTIDYGRVSRTWCIGEAVVTGQPNRVEARVAALLSVLGEYGADEVLVSAPPIDEISTAITQPKPTALAPVEPVGTVITIHSDELHTMLIDALQSWRHGFDMVAIEAPWRLTARKAPCLEPTVAFGPWRELIGQLSGRRFGGTMQVAEGVECWMLLGNPGVPITLVAWVRSDHPHDIVLVNLELGGQHHASYDVFGNSQPLSQRDGVLELTVGRVPVFVE